MKFIDYSDYSLEEIKSNFISNGYRYCTYIQDKASKISYVYFMGFDKNNKPFEFKYRWQCSVGYRLLDKDPKAPIDIYGKSIRYKYFNSTYDRRKFIDNNKDIYDFVDVSSKFVLTFKSWIF